jgi:hypothetical protein
MSGHDDFIARIERFNDSRGGGVVVDYRRGSYTLVLEATGAPIARLSEDADPYAAAWYAKTRFTFSDATAAVRLKIWIGDIYSRSANPLDRQKIPPDRIIRIAQAICHAA